VTDGVTVTLLSASLQQIVCQIPLNEELLRKFIKWRTFSSLVKTKSPKVRPVCLGNKGQEGSKNSQVLLNFYNSFCEWNKVLVSNASAACACQAQRLVVWG
jgi:hypothetical protein